jgi:hypothetical protein
MTTRCGLVLDAIVAGAIPVLAQSRLVLGFAPEACHLFDGEGQALERRVVPEIADARRNRDGQG